MSFSRVHKVEYPENLSVLSQHYYGCPDYALAIYQANRDVIQNPSQIFAGQELVIPHLPHVARK